MSKELSLARQDLVQGPGEGVLLHLARAALHQVRRAASLFLDAVWTYRMTISFAFCVTLFVLLIVSVSRTQEARREATAAEAEAKRIESLHAFIGQMLGAAHVGPLDQGYREALAQRLDTHTPGIARAFPGDLDAQLQLLGIAASVYLAIGDRPSYGELRLRQADLLVTEPERARADFIASLLADAELATAGPASPLVRDLLERAGQLIELAGLERSVLHARWSAASGDAAHARGDRSAAYAAWKSAGEHFAALDIVSTGRFRVLENLGLAALPWQPRVVQGYLQRALDIGQALPTKPMDAMLERIIPALVTVQERNGNIADAMALLETWRNRALESGRQALAMQFTLRLHALGKPQDWTRLVANSSAELLSTQGLAVVDAMFAAGYDLLAAATLERILTADRAGAGTTRQPHSRLLVMRALHVQPKSRSASRVEAALEQALANGEVADARRPRVRLALSDLQMNQGARRTAEAHLRQIIYAANGRVSAEALRARLALAALAFDSGDAAQMLQHTTRAMLEYRHIEAGHDRRLGPAIWAQHGRALAFSNDATSARPWLERARSAYQLLLPEPAARRAVTRIEQELVELVNAVMRIDP